MHAWAAAAIVAAAAIFTVAVFAGTMRCLAAAGGWKALAKKFPAVPAAGDADAGLASVALRGWCAYNNCIRWRADDDHLHLSLPRVLAVGHPPLSIPWGQVEFPEDLGRPGRTLLIRVDGFPIRVPRAMVGRELEVRRAIAAGAGAA